MPPKESAPISAAPPPGVPPLQRFPMCLTCPNRQDSPNHGKDARTRALSTVMKRSLYVLFLICAGILVGSLVAALTKNIGFLSWLSFGLDFGLTQPFVLDLAVLRLTFGLTVNLNISVILFLSLFLAVGLRLYDR